MQNSGSGRECPWDRTWGFIWKSNVRDQQEVAYKGINSSEWLPLNGPLGHPSAWGTQAVSSRNSMEDPLCRRHCNTRACHGEEKMPHSPFWSLRNLHTRWKPQIDAGTPNWPKCIHTGIPNAGKTDILRRAATGPRETCKRWTSTMLCQVQKKEAERKGSRSHHLLARWPWASLISPLWPGYREALSLITGTRLALGFGVFLSLLVVSISISMIFLSGLPFSDCLPSAKHCPGSFHYLILI